MKKILVLFLLLFLPAQIVYSAPSRWLQVGEKQYIDAYSIKSYGVSTLQSVWIKYLNDNNDPFKRIENDYKKFPWYMFNQAIIDCENKKMAIKHVAVYDLKKDLIESNEFPLFWSDIIPESRGEIIHGVVCIPIVRDGFIKLNGERKW